MERTRMDMWGSRRRLVITTRVAGSRRLIQVLGGQGLLQVRTKMIYHYGADGLIRQRARTSSSEQPRMWISSPSRSPQGPPRLQSSSPPTLSSGCLLARSDMLGQLAIEYLP